MLFNIYTIQQFTLKIFTNWNYYCYLKSCAPGYIRRQQGSWLGQCYKEVIENCPTGTYGDPTRGIPCRHCPCPLTSNGNQ